MDVRMAQVRTATLGEHKQRVAARKRKQKRAMAGVRRVKRNKRRG